MNLKRKYQKMGFMYQYWVGNGTISQRTTQTYWPYDHRIVINMSKPLDPAVICEYTDPVGDYAALRSDGKIVIKSRPDRSQAVMKVLRKEKYFSVHKWVDTLCPRVSGEFYEYLDSQPMKYRGYMYKVRGLRKRRTKGCDYYQVPFLTRQSYMMAVALMRMMKELYGFSYYNTSCVVAFSGDLGKYADRYGASAGGNELVSLKDKYDVKHVIPGSYSTYTSGKIIIDLNYKGGVTLRHMGILVGRKCTRFKLGNRPEFARHGDKRYLILGTCEKEEGSFAILYVVDSERYISSLVDSVSMRFVSSRQGNGKNSESEAVVFVQLGPARQVTRFITREEAFSNGKEYK